MNRFFYIIAFVCALQSVPVQAQTDSLFLQWPQERFLEVPVKYFTTDRIQQVYVVTPGNTLIKYSPEGTELFRYSNARMGSLTAIDVTDPFQVLLFYADYRGVEMLDRTLSPVGRWSFDRDDVRAVAMSADNAIWIFDAWSAQLRKVDRNHIALYSSPILSTFTRDAAWPTQLAERNNVLYALFPGKAVWCFDRYGQPAGALPLVPGREFQIADDAIYLPEGNLLHIYHLSQLTTATYFLPCGEVPTGVRLEGERLFCGSQAGIHIFRAPISTGQRGE